MSAFIDEHREVFGVEPICRGVAGRPVDVLRRQSARAPRRRRGRCATASCWPRSERVYAASRRPLRRPEGVVAAAGRGRRGGALHGRAADAPGGSGRRRPRQSAAHHDRRRARRSPDRSGRARLHRDRPQSLWVADFTYVATWSGVVYVAFVIDAFSRRIVGWKADTTMRTSLVLDTLEMALWTRDRAGLPAGAGLIHHHDNGSQYLSFAFTQRLIDAGVDASVGAVGDALRQRPGRVDDRALQDREDPPRRPVEDARRRRAGDAGMGRLVQQRTPAFCLRQTLPSAVRSSSIYKLFKPNKNSLQQSPGQFTGSRTPPPLRTCKSG